MRISELVRRDIVPHEELRSVRRERVEKWFDMRADNFIKSAARGLFTKTIHADHLRAEFKAIARALGGEGRVLEDWFEVRAEAFLQKTAKKTKLEVDEVRQEFKLVAREYGALMHRFDEKSVLRGHHEEDPVGMELQGIIREEEAKELVAQGAE